MVLDSLLWKPLLEASAQVIVGTVGGYALRQVIESALHKNLFEGPLDFWMRGVQNNGVIEGDQVFIDGLISPYSQLFPGNPISNAKKWRKVYEFDGKIDHSQYQAMEFLHGSDSSLRIRSLNGESLVGIYARYGYVGEGLLAVAPTKLLRKVIPNFFDPEYYGSSARIGGIVAKCPTQHGFILQGIAQRAGVQVETSHYRNLHYIQINRIQVDNRTERRTNSLLGSQWSLTDSASQQYLIEYGHFSDSTELTACREHLRARPEWKDTQVYFDDLTALSDDISFSRRFI